jgi:hypothetical protein
MMEIGSARLAVDGAGSSYSNQRGQQDRICSSYGSHVVSPFAGLYPRLLTERILLWFPTTVPADN